MILKFNKTLWVYKFQIFDKKTFGPELFPSNQALSVL